MRIVALDLGAKKTAYCEVQDQQVVHRATLSSEAGLRLLLGPDQPEAKVAIEASREAWHYYDLLGSWGNKVILVDTTRSRQLGIGQHRRKTDRIDAEVLAKALARGLIPRAHVLSAPRRELRRILGVRRALVESRAQMVTTIRGLAREQGQPLPGCETEQFTKMVKRQRTSAQLMARMEPLLVVLESIEAQLTKVDDELAAVSAGEPAIRLLTTAPGVGTVVAAAFVSVVDEAKRFRKGHQLQSYLGLVPCESTTGGKRRLGSISKQGNSYMRALLVQAAWTILRSTDLSDPLRLWGQQVAGRRGKQVAVVAVARRLAAVLWAMWRDGTVYDKQHLAAQGIRGLRGAMQTLEHQQQALERAAKKRSVKKPTTATTRTSTSISAASAAH
jgi:transposase